MTDFACVWTPILGREVCVRSVGMSVGRTSSVLLGEVAVMAENLEAGGIVMSPQPGINRSADNAAMLAASAVYMVDSEEDGRSLTTADTSSAIGGEGTYSQASRILTARGASSFKILESQAGVARSSARANWKRRQRLRLFAERAEQRLIRQGPCLLPLFVAQVAAAIARLSVAISGLRRPTKGLDRLGLLARETRLGLDSEAFAVDHPPLLVVLAAEASRSGRLRASIFRARRIRHSVPPGQVRTCLGSFARRRGFISYYRMWRAP